jgi:hypothetical protein
VRYRAAVCDLRRRLAIGDDHRERVAARYGVVLFDVPAEDELISETDR